jgi:hypothetical protein
MKAAEIGQSVWRLGYVLDVPEFESLVVKRIYFKT